MKALGYVRVSTAEQLDGGGLDIQTGAIVEHCKARHHQLVQVVADGDVSGTLETRPGLTEILGRLEAGEAAVLVVPRLDRLARDLMIQEATIRKLQDMGIRVESVVEEDIDSQDPTRVLVRQMLGAIAQYEAALIRGRLAGGREAKRSRGGWIGGNVPYGYRTEDGELVPDSQEIAGKQLACRLRSEGNSLRAIAAAMTDAGYHPKRAKKWTAETIRSITQA